MKPGGANRKGAGFEIETCRILTQWITGKRTPEIFWRTAISGAKATQDHKAGRSVVMGGDITAIDPRAHWFTSHFVVECKDRKDYGNLDLLFIGKGEFLSWWSRCVGDAEREAKWPLLIFKRYMKDILCAYRKDRFVPSYLSPRYPRAEFSLPGQGTIVVSRFEDWLNSFPAASLEKSCQQYVRGKLPLL